VKLSLLCASSPTAQTLEFKNKDQSVECIEEMSNKNIPFQTIDWTKVSRTEHKGETGVAYWQTMQF